MTRESTSTTPDRAATGQGGPDRLSLLRSPLIRIMLGNLGVAQMLYISLLVLLPAQSTRIGGTAHKTTVLAVAAGVGAVVALVAAVGAGHVSDRLLTARGSRGSVLTAGAVIGAVLLPVVPLTDSLGELVAVWCVVQVGLNGVLSVVTAALADWFGVERRGVASAYAALGQVLGAMAASALVIVAGSHPGAVGLTGGVLFLVTVLPMNLAPARNAASPAELPSTSSSRQQEQQPAVAATPESPSPRREWQNPYTDVTLAWLVRFVVTFSNTLVITYLDYYVTDVLHPANPQRLIGLAAGLTSLMVAAGAVAAGRLSDRSGRRRPFVLASVVLMCVGELFLAGWHTVPSAFCAAVLVGLGYGVYLSVDQALSADVLPLASAYGRDFGIMNTATSAPQIVAPVVAALLLGSSKDYTTLFGVGAVAALSAIGFVAPIRRVR